MNNLMKPSTMLSDKAELIELSKDSILHTGFKFIDLSIPVRYIFLWACPNILTTNTLEVLNNEDKTKELGRFMQIKCRDCEFKRSFYPSFQTESSERQS